MKRALLLAVLFFGVIASSHAGKIYKWTDEKGQIHYSTFPPAQAETEKVRVPGSNQPSKQDAKKQRSSSSQKLKFRNLRSGETAYGKAAKRKEKYEERKKKQAAKHYDRKYGPEAKLKRLEREKRQKEARAERVHRERIRRVEQEKKAKAFEKKMDKFKKKVMGLEGECKAAHGTDCTNPAYLNKWARKKYEKKK